MKTKGIEIKCVMFFFIEICIKNSTRHFLKLSLLLWTKTILNLEQSVPKSMRNESEKNNHKICVDIRAKVRTQGNLDQNYSTILRILNKLD